MKYINKILSGRRNDFAFLVDKYKGMVFSICNRIIRDARDAEEAAQDAFVKTFAGLKRFDSRAKFSTWLYRIAYNTAVSYSRRQKPESANVSLSDKEDYFDTSAGDESPSLSMEKREMKNALDAALASLEETDSVMVILKYYEEASVAEISKITGLTAPNVKIRLFRARNKMRDFLLKTQEIIYEN